jgi:hypothetical protein
MSSPARNLTSNSGSRLSASKPANEGKEWCKKVLDSGDQRGHSGQVSG